jgi:hypothetical protein
VPRKQAEPNLERTWIILQPFRAPEGALLLTKEAENDIETAL